jgi:hypothetical protein
MRTPAQLKMRRVLLSLLVLWACTCACDARDRHRRGRHHRLREPRHLRIGAGGSLFPKPDECAARDDAVAAAKGRTCQRRCASDKDCLNDRKLCLCDGVCGLSCIRPEKECPELPDPPHGQVHLTGR